MLEGQPQAPNRAGTPYSWNHCENTSDHTMWNFITLSFIVQKIQRLFQRKLHFAQLWCVCHSYLNPFHFFSVLLKYNDVYLLESYVYDETMYNSRDIVLPIFEISIGREIIIILEIYILDSKMYFAKFHELHIWNSTAK